jgi:hypothetical protein
MEFSLQRRVVSVAIMMPRIKNGNVCVFRAKEIIDGHAEQGTDALRSLSCYRHCEERSDEAIQFLLLDLWIASRSLSSGGVSRRPVGSQ